jgi:hypothetical protein
MALDDGMLAVVRLIRIDQGTQGFNALEPGIEIETQLAGERQIRTLPVSMTRDSSGVAASL